MKHAYPRDLIGYGQYPPHPKWPNQAKIAIQFVLNYEEGAESSVLHGDEHSETFLSEIIGAQAYPDRHLSMESMYEYGSRAGFWRLYNLFVRYQLPVTVFGVTMALQRNPEAVAAMKQANWEIASHAMRWLPFQDMPEVQEKKMINASVQLHQAITGSKPTGWYTGRTSPNTLKLISERDDILYCADSYADDLPYYDTQYAKPLLIVPYTLDTNDMRFATPQGFNSGEQFYQYLKDAFDVLYAEGETAPKMLSIGLHCRIIGRPARMAGLQRFIEYAQSHEKVWCCTREQIALHWKEHFPFKK
ncbi:MAG: allantoinase [Paraglaciecola sp.]|jgi:allantoinase